MFMFEFAFKRMQFIHHRIMYIYEIIGFISSSLPPFIRGGCLLFIVLCVRFFLSSLLLYAVCCMMYAPCSILHADIFFIFFFQYLNFFSFHRYVWLHTLLPSRMKINRNNSYSIRMRAINIPRAYMINDQFAFRHQSGCNSFLQFETNIVHRSHYNIN